MNHETKNLILELYAIGAIKFGSFPLKSGILSPIYIDLRLLISYPHLMKNLSIAVDKLISQFSFDVLCGVPYAALPFATAVSLQGDYPMIMCRKEAKGHGTKKMIEGKFAEGQFCLLIEDVSTSGASILETASALNKEGLKISDAVVLLDREQGAKQKLKEHGIHLHPLISIFDVLQVLFSAEKSLRRHSRTFMAFLKALC